MRADNLAAEAARAAGGQAIDVDLVAETGQHRVDPALAMEYARRYLNCRAQRARMSYDITLIDDTTVAIEVELPYRNRVLGMFGRSDVQVTGTAVAVLVSGP